jgi:hypothetical protein
MKNKKITAGLEPANRPKAWIAVSNNRQKIYSDGGETTGKVYLRDGQEFQIELYNPTTITFLAKIYINGSLMSYSGIVIKPGQRYFLDRFIDVNKKLTFSTYDVENTKQSQEAISRNGLVKVEFYSEHIIPQYNQYWWNGSTITTNCTPTFTDYGYFRDHGNYSAPYSTFCSNSTTDTFGGNIGTNSTYFCNSTLSSSEASKSIETGRVEGGKKSDQSFDEDYGVYSSLISHSDTYKILPISVKPLDVSDIRSYCHGCGTRIKRSNWKFCPTCGENLE